MVAAAFAGPAAAQNSPPVLPQLGRWSIVSELGPEAMLLSAMMPPALQQQLGYDPKSNTITTPLCLNSETIKQWESMGRAALAGRATGCGEPTWTGDAARMTMTVACSGANPATVKITYRVSPARDAYTMTGELTTGIVSSAAPQVVRLNARARRVGDC
ncbi:MAG: DUF3617 family protein [Burkholderiales bacterium]